MVRVAIAGGTSPTLGRSIVTAILATGRHEAIILSRARDDGTVSALKLNPESLYIPHMLVLNQFLLLYQPFANIYRLRSVLRDEPAHRQSDTTAPYQADRYLKVFGSTENPDHRHVHQRRG